MGSFPYFTNVKPYVLEKLNKRKGNPYEVSKLNSWIRVCSGAGNGLMLYSNPSFALFRGAGDSNVASIYGNNNSSGVIGVDWGGSPVYARGQGFQPSPVISSIQIEEGSGGDLSRKASFSITAYTKEQNDLLMEYFLEPGYSVFIEWGWNTSDAVVGWQATLSGNYVANFQSLTELIKKRDATRGDYDNYLGFITGGSVSLSESTWTISVSCNGYPELAAYLTASENAEDSTDPDSINPNPPEHFGSSAIKNSGLSSQYGKERFMMMFNELPDTRKTKRVQSLIDELSGVENYINFDPDVSESINGRTDGALFGLIQNRVRIGDGNAIALPIGTKIISNNRFIKFSALMSIINAIGVEGVELDNKQVVKFKINTANTYCIGFDHMFSIDPTKLFIPNSLTPKFKLSISGLDLENVSDNTINGITFPEIVKLDTVGVLGEKISADAYKWGNLDNLYVNFDFAAGIIETKNLVVKDALYQILNGMSSAVNGLWDFQIIERQSEEDNVTELTVVDLNFRNVMNDAVTLEIDSYGEQSILISSNFDLSLSGAKMDQIIAQRYDRSINQQGKDFPNLFSTKTDLVVRDIRVSELVEPIKTQTLTDSEKTQVSIDVLLNRLYLYPRIEFFDRYQVGSNELYDICYVGAFKDADTFAKIKKKELSNMPNRSSLLPIEFTFTIHGISGIKRGDMFRVNGLPQVYSSQSAFFQVLSVQHSISDMTWTTEVKGGWRV